MKRDDPSEKRSQSRGGEREISRHVDMGQSSSRSCSMGEKRKEEGEGEEEKIVFIVGGREAHSLIVSRDRQSERSLSSERSGLQIRTSRRRVDDYDCYEFVCLI